MKIEKENIKQLAKQYKNDVIAMRRHLHSHPELSTQEFKTADYISSQLKSYGIPFKQGIAKTGIVAMIEGKNSSKKIIALRADMDALPINEENQSDYKSLNDGVMHACGHDVHMACLLGAARILNDIKENLNGSIKIIFQPSEETYPGGAIQMIDQGVLENPTVSTAIAQHVLPTLDAGKIGLKSGKYMASTDEVFITIKGKGGHAATPELIIDPILIASKVRLALSEIPSMNPSVPTVVAFGKFTALGRTNIIPDTATLEGTIRTYDEVWRKKIHQQINEISSQIAIEMGAQCKVVIHNGYPFLTNDKNVTDAVRKSAIDYLGEENVVELDQRMTAEDFAYFSQRIPSCMYRLGTKDPKSKDIRNIHTSTFDVDENSIELGMGLMAWIAANELE